jgi:Na+/H+ antiporter NhaD/arsenite permease-like protein
MEFKVITTITVFVIVYGVIAFEMMNRASIALLGASFLLLLRVISFETAFSKVDFEVITLLISMMVIVSVTNETGVFHYIAIKTAKIVRGDPLKILVLLMVLTAVLSAIIDNVTTVLVISPLSILIARELSISPLPFLITQAIASNIGGTATLIGHPPNIMIGYGAKLTFNDFLFNMLPLVLVVTIVSIFITILLFRKSLSIPDERKERIMLFNESSAIGDKIFLVKSLCVLLFVIGGFLFYSVVRVDPAVVAFFGATLLLFLSHNAHHDRYFGEIEWTTIFFFIGLYILVGTMDELGIIGFIGNKLVDLSGNNINYAVMIVLWGSGILAGFIDNIPLTAAMIPVVKILITDFGPSFYDALWWSLSAGACLGGNFTLIGACANIVTAGIASKNGYTISFLEFTKYGVLYTFISLVISSFYIYFRYLL